MKKFILHILLALAIGLAGYLLWLPLGLHIEKWGWDYMNTRHEDWGLFGDYIGGVFGTVLTSATLFYLIRQDSLAKRRRLTEDAAKRIQDVMSLHRSVLAAVKLHAYEKGVALPKDGVEGMWRIYAGHFAINLHINLIPKAIDLVSTNEHSWKEIVTSGWWSHEMEGPMHFATKDAFLAELNWWSDIHKRNDKTFDERAMIRNLNAITYSLDSKTLKEETLSTYKQVFENVGYLFGHYHRNLYYVLQVLDEAPYSDVEKERQAKLFRSMLSGAELVMIHLNIYCGYDKSTGGEYKFRELVRRYKILEDLEMHMFAHREVYLRDGTTS